MGLYMCKIDNHIEKIMTAYPHRMDINMKLDSDRAQLKTVTK